MTQPRDDVWANYQLSTVEALPPLFASDKGERQRFAAMGLLGRPWTAFSSNLDMEPPSILLDSTHRGERKHNDNPLLGPMGTLRTISWALHTAIGANELEGVMTALNLSADPNLEFVPGVSPLSKAVFHGNFDVCRLLLDAKANPEHPDGAGQTPLHIAAHRCYPAIVNLLIQNKASFLHPDGRSPSAMRQAVLTFHRSAGRTDCQSMALILHTLVKGLDAELAQVVRKLQMYEGTEKLDEEERYAIAHDKDLRDKLEREGYQTKGKVVKYFHHGTNTYLNYSTLIKVQVEWPAKDETDEIKNVRVANCVISSSEKIAPLRETVDIEKVKIANVEEVQTEELRDELPAPEQNNFREPGSFFSDARPSKEILTQAAGSFFSLVDSKASTYAGRRENVSLLARMQMATAPIGSQNAIQKKEVSDTYRPVKDRARRAGGLKMYMQAAEASESYRSEIGYSQIYARSFDVNHHMDNASKHREQYPRIGDGASVNRSLHEAIAARDMGGLRKALQAGACLDGNFLGGMSPLHKAAFHGSVDITQMLLRRKANANITDSSGQSAMHIAALMVEPQICQCLLKHRCSITIMDNQGLSSLRAAVDLLHDPRGHVDQRKLALVLDVLSKETDSVYRQLKATLDVHEANAARLMETMNPDTGRPEDMLGKLPGEQQVSNEKSWHHRRSTELLQLEEAVGHLKERQSLLEPVPPPTSPPVKPHPGSQKYMAEESAVQRFIAAEIAEHPPPEARYSRSGGVVDLVVCSAKDLLARDKAILGKSSSDPFVIIYAGRDREVFRTKVVDKSLNPVWNEACQFQVEATETILIFKLFDRDPKTDEALGEVSLELSRVSGTKETLSLDVKPNKDCKKAKGCLEIQVAISSKATTRS